ncbi:MAG TPA: CHAT domain-containing tetratricopeptide repeat protein [Thermoanaerobaculia bacterium]|jgi:CHAT domain-containing protein/tetratricopeptide (TPR) repeat protein|nr:CHAT domain-containing tetratricopeptide repeat protein [Thermoanaerobaculia bacterium]
MLLFLCVLGCRGEKKTVPSASRPARATVAATPAPVCVGASSLSIPVQPGDYIHAVAGQESRDVALKLFDPQGRQLLRIDSLVAPATHPLPAEEIHWVADAPGELRIELTVPSGFHGPCDLRLADRRPATAADRRRALAEAELARAHELRRTKTPESCRAGIAVYESAQSRFADLGLPRRQAEALLGLGLLQRYCLLADNAALQVFIRAEPFFPGEPAFEALVRQHLGELRFNLGDLEGAIGEDRRALALSRRIGERTMEALSSSDLGCALHLLGHYDEAAIQLDRALALWKPGDEPAKRAMSLLNRGQLHRQLGEADQARERLRAALALFRQAKDHDGEATVLNALGFLALEAGQPGAALEPFQGALALRSPGSHGRAVTLASLGVAYRQLDRLEEARRVYTEALSIFRGLGDSRDQARSLGNLGQLEASTGHDAAALGDFDRALGLFRALADSLNTAEVLEGKAWVLHRRGDLEAARGLMEEALAMVERRRFSQTSYTTRAAFFATQQDSYDSLIDLLMEMHRKAPTAGYAAAALKVSERSLARSLLDGLAVGGTRLGRGEAAPELHARERELETEIGVLVSRETRLTQEGGTAALWQPVEAELRRRWDDLDRVRAGLRASDPHYAALTQPQPWSAAEIQRGLLDRDTLLLEYRLGKKRSFLWAVTPNSLASFSLPGRDEIERVARPACDLLARSSSRKAEGSVGPQLSKLSHLLLEPVAPLLPGKRLLIVSDGILQNVPFAALPEPGTGPNGEPLVTRHEIVALPSASVLGELRRETTGRAPAPKSLWVLADPEFGGLFAPLPYSRQEAEAILGLAPASERFEVLGREASRAAVLKSGALSDYRFLHFATHGLFATTDPGGGRLVLAQIDPRGRPEANGFLHLADIYELDLRADLVVLSACQSALGREVRGEGMMGMTRGFFYAGAERVLVSLWNVNDQVTVEMMRRFYRGMLSERLSPAAALRAAQDSIRREERWHAPYYWAGFTLQGEYR